MILHDAACLDGVKNRLRTLRPDATRQWGKMTVDQMLWHVNQGFENALGRYPVRKINIPMPSPLVKWIVFNLPWRRGKTPTAPEYVASGEHDFEKERERSLALIDEFVRKPMTASWPESSFLGRMSGNDWSRLMAKHVDHHLTQFGA